MGVPPALDTGVGFYANQCFIENGQDAAMGNRKWLDRNFHPVDANTGDFHDRILMEPLIDSATMSNQPRYL